MGIVSYTASVLDIECSHLARSTRNTRIERAWVEIGRAFVRRWRVFFARLESSFGLDVNNPRHLWLLNTLFLDDINRDCQEFVDDWNNHSLKNTEQGSKTPKASKQLYSISYCIFNYS